MPRPRRGISEREQAPEYRYTVKDMPAGERPRERLLEQGPAALSNAELLAIILRTGIPGQPVTEMASKLLSHFRRLDDIRKASTKELCDGVPGLGPAKVAQVKAALELGRRLQVEAAPDRSYAISSPENVAELLRLDLEHEDQECL
ncbi:MAG: helix-hairpin-helix domain-containing protein, partial [Bacteroidetes bacterium]|nr:helix-hairpin-helix domain-containing protein [Bacteroidota bacterium]